MTPEELARCLPYLALAFLADWLRRHIKAVLIDLQKRVCSDD